MSAQFSQQNRDWAGLKILVTGGSGFIGRHLCRRLCELGSEVHATSRHQHPQVEGPTWWHADMAHLADARRVFAAVKPDIVFHLAGSVGARPDIELLLPTYHSLLTSTVNVLQSATERGCRRVVLAGSSLEPGAGEAEPRTPQSPYAAAKWAASGYGRMFHTLYRTPVVVLHLFLTYGPGQAPSKLIPSVIRSLTRGEPPKVASGKTRADWIFIADAVESFLRAAITPGIDGRTIDIGSGRSTAIRHIVELLVEVTGSRVKPMFGALPDRPGEREVVADTAAALELFGWKATTPLESGLRQTVEWFRAQGIDAAAHV